MIDAIKERWPMYKDDYYKDKILENGISNTAKFFILNGGLNIAFAKYEIACGAYSEPEFPIPTEVIEDILNPEYKEIIK